MVSRCVRFFVDFVRSRKAFDDVCDDDIHPARSEMRTASSRHERYSLLLLLSIVRYVSYDMYFLERVGPPY